MNLHEKVVDRLEEIRQLNTSYTEDELEEALTWVIEHHQMVW